MKAMMEQFRATETAMRLSELKVNVCYLGLVPLRDPFDFRIFAGNPTVRTAGFIRPARRVEDERIMRRGGMECLVRVRRVSWRDPVAGRNRHLSGHQCLLVWTDPEAGWCGTRELITPGNPICLGFLGCHLCEII